MVYVIQLVSRSRTELQFRPDRAPAHQLSANLHDIDHRCVYSEKLLMMDRGTVRNMLEFYSKNKFEKLVHLVGFVIRMYHDARSPERNILSTSSSVTFNSSVPTSKAIYCAPYTYIDHLVLLIQGYSK